MDAYETLRQTAFKSVNQTLHNQSEALKNLNKQYQTCEFSQSQLLRSIDILYQTVAPGSHGKIVVSGIGKSYKIATKMVATLNSLSIHSSVLHPAEALHGDLGVIKDDDCIVLLTASGNTPELLQLLPHFPPHVPVVLLTCSRHSQLSQHQQVRALMFAELPLHLKEDAIHGIPAPTVSTTLSLALADAAILALSEMINADLATRKALFLKKHPGGSIGSDLRSVLNTTNDPSKDDSKSSFSSQVSYSSLLSLNNIRQLYNSMSQPSHSQSSSQCSQSMSRSITSSDADDDEYQTVTKDFAQISPKSLPSKPAQNDMNSNPQNDISSTTEDNDAPKDTIETSTNQAFALQNSDELAVDLNLSRELKQASPALILKLAVTDFLAYNQTQLLQSVVFYDYIVISGKSSPTLAIKSAGLREFMRSKRGCIDNRDSELTTEVVDKMSPVQLG